VHRNNAMCIFYYDIQIGINSSTSSWTKNIKWNYSLKMMHLNTDGRTEMIFFPQPGGAIKLRQKTCNDEREISGCVCCSSPPSRTSGDSQWSPKAFVVNTSRSWTMLECCSFFQTSMRAIHLVLTKRNPKTGRSIRVRHFEP